MKTIYMGVAAAEKRKDSNKDALSYPCRVWNLQFGVSGGLDSDDCLVSETANGADVLIRHIAQCTARGSRFRTAAEIKRTFASATRARRPPKKRIHKQTAACKGYL